MQSELKPCAHCGGAAECDSRQAFRSMSSGKIRNRFAIYCTSCNADMGFCYDDIESCNHDAAVDQTTAAWNTRASDAEITRLTEALRLQMEAKHEEAEEAKLWFSKAQEWKEALRAAEEREKGLREAVDRLRNGYADAVSGYRYILTQHGRLEGVGFDRVMDHYHDWVAMPEREGLLAGSHTLAGAKP